MLTPQDESLPEARDDMVIKPAWSDDLHLLDLRIIK